MKERTGSATYLSYARPHRSLNPLMPVEDCSKLLNNENPSILQIYWTKNIFRYYFVVISGTVCSFELLVMMA